MCCSFEHEAEYGKLVLVTIIAKHALEVSLVPQTLPQAHLRFYIISDACLKSIEALEEEYGGRD